MIVLLLKCSPHSLVDLKTVFVPLFQATLYPTVGLQTPGEVVEANFGQSQFVFDLDDYLKVCSSSSFLNLIINYSNN